MKKDVDFTGPLEFFKKLNLEADEKPASEDREDKPETKSILENLAVW